MSSFFHDEPIFFSVKEVEIVLNCFDLFYPGPEFLWDITELQNIQIFFNYYHIYDIYMINKWFLEISPSLSLSFIWFETQYVMFAK